MSRLIAAVVMVAGMAPLSLESRAGDITNLIPSNAYGYVLINNIGELDGKITALGKRIETQIPSPLTLLESELGIAAGFDRDGAAAIAIVPDGPSPAGLLLVAVDDYPALLAQIDVEEPDGDVVSATIAGVEWIVAKKDGHAVMALPNNRELVEQVLAVADGSSDGDDQSPRAAGDYDVEIVVSTSGTDTLCALGKQGIAVMKEVVQQQVGDDNPALAGLEIYISLSN
ncbi:MAG: hypothetical protein AAF961_12330, partial [Planctomycetota bacterium]